MRSGMMGRSVWLVVAVVAGVTSFGRAVEAQQTQCFHVEGGEAAARGRVQHVVGLSSVVRLSGRCSYALSVQGPWVSASALTGRASDFLELLHLLTENEGDGERAGDPRFIFGRPRAQPSPVAARGQLHTLILRYCSHYLLEEQLGFRVIPNGTEGGVRIERSSGAAEQQCGAEQLELRAEQGSGSSLLSATARDETRRLSVGESELILPRGEWAVYAARPRGRVGLRVGVFRARGVSTPLQEHLRDVGLSERTGSTPPALLTARWEPRLDGVRLLPTEHASSQGILWAELRTAADAGLLWLARGSGSEGQDAVSDAPVVMGDVTLEAGQPQLLRIPDRPVREHMTARYGETGQSLAPTLEDWAAVFDELALCLTPSYLEQQAASPGGAVPDAGSCAALRSLIDLEPSGGGGGGAARVCLRRGMQVIGAEGARWAAASEEPECSPLPSGEGPRPRQMAVVGDSLTIENGADLCVLIDNRRIEAEGGVYHLRRSGLLEVRQGGGVDCASAQALSRLRIPVLDPEREWHPVGLYTEEEVSSCAAEGEEGVGSADERCPWRGLAHDEDEVFAYVRSRHSLEFRLSTSPAVAAVINRDPDAEVVVSRDIPLLSGVSGDFEGPEAPAVFAFVSRDGQCPSGEGATVTELRSQRPIEPDGEIVDRVFHLFLATAEDEEQSPRCLARSTFRVRHSRSLVNATAGRVIGVELGLLGDTQAVFYFTQPVALGVALPVFYFRLNLFPVRNQRWLALEIAGDLTFSAAFDPAGISRTGAALAIALQLGVPKWVPRLLSVGVMIHGAWESLPEEEGEDNNPIVSGYIGLDLSTLIDLAGGR